jgi:hypothetical protein
MNQAKDVITVARGLPLLLENLYTDSTLVSLKKKTPQVFVWQRVYRRD